jgi:hypothetical protein
VGVHRTHQPPLYLEQAIMQRMAKAKSVSSTAAEGAWFAAGSVTSHRITDSDFPSFYILFNYMAKLRRRKHPHRGLRARCMEDMEVE